MKGKKNPFVFLLPLLIFLWGSAALKPVDFRSGVVNPNPPGSFVAKHGSLRINGTRLVDQRSIPVQLKGMSAFWINWDNGAKYANRDVVNTLVDDWGCTVYRLAVGIEPDGAYIQNPTKYTSVITEVVDACIEKGIYVIIDWHSHDTLLYGDQEAAFFQGLARIYGEYPNVIYELWNEPVKQSWSDEVRPYTQKIIDEAIRPVDPDNIILAGSPSWSQDLHLCAADPLIGTNIMYTLHFYAGTHTGWLMGRAEKAMKDGLPVFVSEWGTSAADGGSDGSLYLSESGDWIDWMNQNGISWCNWSVSDKKESSAALNPGADPRGHWTDKEISRSGLYVRKMIRGE